MSPDDIDYIEFRLWKAVDKNWSGWQGSAVVQHRIDGVGFATRIEQVGGPYAGDYNAPAHLIIKLESDNGNVVRFFKKSGYYDSYNGTDWDGPFVEVFPKTQTITTYEEN